MRASFEWVCSGVERERAQKEAEGHVHVRARFRINMLVRAQQSASFLVRSCTRKFLEGTKRIFIHVMVREASSVLMSFSPLYAIEAKFDIF